MTMPSVDTLIASLADDLQQWASKHNIQEPAMVGIHSGGAWVATKLHEMLGLSTPLGTLDITFYRDDFTQKGLHPNVNPSELPFVTEGQHIILVDDVVMSGRTIRAAMNELFDYGRPASITLVALVSLPGREIPIQPDIVGQQMDLNPNQRVKLRGPAPLKLELIEID